MLGGRSSRGFLLYILIVSRHMHILIVSRHMRDLTVDFVLAETFYDGTTIGKVFSCTANILGCTHLLGLL